MTKTILLFGGIAGAVIMAAMLVNITFVDTTHGDSAVWLGYLTMIVGLSMIFIGVKRYRDIERGGVIKFLTAFGMGLGIAFMASLIYVAVWEAYLAATHYTFMDNYAAQMIEAKRAEGVTGAALQSFTNEMEQMRVSYRNPLYRMPLTFIEIFPVGLIISLLSALFLKFFPRRAAQTVTG